MIASYITTILYAYDKQSASTNSPRLSEYYALVMTALGGSFGAIIGTVLFDHKSQMSRKWYYLIMLIVSTVVQVLILLALLGVIKF